NPVGYQETDGARDREDHHEPGRAIQLLDGGTELPDPEHVEENVQNAAVKIDAGEDGPPVANAPRSGAGRSQRNQSGVARRERIERIARGEGSPRIEEQAQRVQSDAGDGDDVGEAVAPEDRAQRGGEAPHAGVAAAADQTLVRFSAREATT